MNKWNKHIQKSNGIGKIHIYNGKDTKCKAISRRKLKIEECREVEITHNTSSLSNKHKICQNCRNTKKKPNRKKLPPGIKRTRIGSRSEIRKPKNSFIWYQ